MSSGESSLPPEGLRYSERLLWNAAVEHGHEDHQTILARLARERTERQRMADMLHEVAARITDDRREPDKILCHAQTARRAAFSS